MAKNLVNGPNIIIVENGDNINLELSSSYTDFLDNKINNVIQSGSNENGNWVKYSDGTMICWNHIEVTDQAIDTAYGSLYLGSRTISFPVAFNSTPSVHCSLFHWGTSASWGCVASATTTAASIRGLDNFSRATGTICEISWQAIGRWK